MKMFAFRLSFLMVNNSNIQKKRRENDRLYLQHLPKTIQFRRCGWCDFHKFWCKLHTMPIGIWLYLHGEQREKSPIVANKIVDTNTNSASLFWGFLVLSILWFILSQLIDCISISFCYFFLQSNDFSHLSSIVDRYANKFELKRDIF